MNSQKILTLVLIITPHLFFCADNKQITEKEIQKTTEFNSTLTPASNYTVLYSFKALRNKENTISMSTYTNTETEQITENELEKNLTTQVKLLFPKKTGLTKKLIPTTLKIAEIFCTQKTAECRDWSKLHSEILKLPPQTKIAILTITHHLLAPKKLQYIIAHNLKKDVAKYEWLFDFYKKQFETCQFKITNTKWAKIGIFKGTKKPIPNTLFTQQNLLQIPLIEGSKTVDLTTGKEIVAPNQEKEIEKQLQIETQTIASNTRQRITRGNYNIYIEPFIEKFSDKNRIMCNVKIEKTSYTKAKLFKQIRLTDRFFAIIERFEDWSKESPRAHLINFEQNSDQELPILRSIDKKSGGGTVSYNGTKIRYTKDTVFAKGRSKIVAVDLRSGFQTTFRSDYIIRDIYISPDNKHIAICEDLGKDEYIYHVFKLETESIPLATYLSQKLVPSTDLYGSTKSIFSGISTLFGY